MPGNEPSGNRDDAERWSTGRAEFNEGWGEAVAKVNRARERGEWPFTLSRPGWDALSDEERDRAR